MKNLYRILFNVLLITSVFQAQQASDYFPENTGFTWIYRVMPLDSLNIPVTSQTFFRVDSFTTTKDYEGKLAKVLVSKEGTAEIINLLPYTDSSFYHFSGADGFEYLDVGRLELFLTILDSIVADSNFSFLNIFRSFEDWYSTFRFGSNINEEYILFSIDTSVVINSINIPLRFEYNAVRLDDEILETDLGTFICKKFIRERGISFLITPPPPIPPIPIPIAFFNDTIWIAENNWIVQSILPATEIDLGLITGDTLSLPGVHAIITDAVTGIQNLNTIPAGFNLLQNFPNPFNPVTTIQFEVSETRHVNLTVFDILGNEISTLINKELPAGRYNIDFDAAGLSSGFYIYRLQTDNIFISKKMILLK